MGPGLRRGRHEAGLLLRRRAGLLLGDRPVLRLPLLGGSVVPGHTAAARGALLVATALQKWIWVGQSGAAVL